MKNCNCTTHHSLGALAASLLFTATLAASEPAAAPAKPAQPDTIAEIFSKGKVAFNERFRFESVDQSNRRDADAFTFRTALTYTTAPYQGFTASVQMEDVTALPGSDYVAAPASSTTVAHRAVISDPVGTEVNQAWLSYKTGKTVYKAGRFNLVLDNVRFIGNVGWRQNNQTFDGFTVTDTSVDKLALNYAYLTHINRIFGANIAGGDWKSDSHILNASYSGWSAGTLTGYAYLLDFDNAAVQSCSTFGASFAGGQKISETAKIIYRAELARQADYQSSTLNYSANYLLGELGFAEKSYGFGVGYEKLGTDNGVSFRTPLATLHAFNGWADQFLTTPANGLVDTYVKGNISITPELGLLAFYHKFETDSGSTDLGKEIDVQLTYKFSKYLTGLVKYAKFDRDLSSMADVKKFWAQAEFNF